jgi:tetratricopeptide (TPR) repeat protein
MDLGQPKRALEDMDRVVALDPKPVDLLSRGDVHRHMCEYRKALDDYDRGEGMDPAGWEADALGLLFQADCHARLGDEDEALTYCARLPDDFWTPGLNGAPAGGKAGIADALRRMAASVRAQQA